MFGYRMATDERDQLDVWFAIRSAIRDRCPVRVSFFKTLKDENHRPVQDAHGYFLYAKVTRVVEPFELTTTRDGRHIAKVVDRSPEGMDSRPEYRTIRLDRVAVSNRTKRPLLTVMRTYGFLCPSPLDGQELHPRKGALAQRKPGILLAPVA